MEEYDVLQTLECGSYIQHGPRNDKIYLIRKGGISAGELAVNLIDMAQELGYSKIVAKVARADLDVYLNQGYSIEAIVPKFYSDNDDLFFVSMYFTKSRFSEDDYDKYQDVLGAALQNINNKSGSVNNVGIIRKCCVADIPQMIDIYKQAFASYPLPILDPEYLERTMGSYVDYFCVDDGERIIGLASAENDMGNMASEMTDFAVRPDTRVKGLALALLEAMEESSVESGMKTLFSIARAGSFGMNISLARAGFGYGGRLKNDTDIGGAVESMNIWYKNI